MSIEKAITDFREKLVRPLFADITRTLEVTCHKPGDDNHGSNFVGNAAVLSGIETLAQFFDSNTEEEHRAFRKQAKEQYKSIEKEKKKYVTPRYSPSEGSELAKTFMKKYFCDSVFQKKEFGARIPVHDLIWAFRNPHMHAFYPYYQRTFDTKKVCGAVDWLYRDSVKRIGITINEVESEFDARKQQLYRIEGEWFRICPQILFVFFKQAVEKFIAEVRDIDDVQKQFCQNYKRLAESYGFHAYLDRNNLPDYIKMDYQEIRKTAYLKWEAEGRPEGRDMEFWLRAETEYARTHGL